MDNKEKIIGVLKKNTNGLSATAIANAIGFSKSAKIMPDLDSLVEDGSIIVEQGGRFNVYKIAAKITKTQVKETTSVVSAPKNDSSVLPELPENELEGYVISTVKKDGVLMKRIVCPNGKKILLKSDEKIVVINNEPKYVVKTAQEIIACIQKYSSDNGLNVFTVNDIKQNKKISTEKDLMVNDNHIISLKIQKHNKAA